jgi:Flp pilus assembly protein TadB
MTIPGTATEIDTMQEFQAHYLKGMQFSKQNRWTQALMEFEKAKSYNQNSDSLIKRINDAREQLKNKNQTHIDESQFAVVEGRQWNSGWLLGLTVFIAALIFLVIFRRYLRKSAVTDS